MKNIFNLENMCTCICVLYLYRILFFWMVVVLDNDNNGSMAWMNELHRNSSHSTIIQFQFRGIGRIWVNECCVSIFCKDKAFSSSGPGGSSTWWGEEDKITNTQFRKRSSNPSIKANKLLFLSHFPWKTVQQQLLYKLVSRIKWN